MDRYKLFQLLLAMLSDNYEIKNAMMRDYSDRISIEATGLNNDVKIEVTVTGREDTDANKA